MPRPDKETRKRIEANKKRNAALRDDAAEREKRVAAQVEKIVSGALVRSRGREALPNVPELIQQLEEARLLAMASGQAKAAVDAVMAQGRLLGLVIDRSAVAVAGVGFGGQAKTHDEIIRDMRESIGNEATQQFLQAIEDMRRTYNGRSDDDAIEVEYRRNGNGSADGGG